MLDLIAGALAAFNQIIAFTIALFFLGVALVIIGSEIRWRLRALRVNGTITGVRKTGAMYHTVYHYTLPDGRSYEGTSNSASSSITGRDTGRSVPLMVMPADPEAATPVNEYLWDITGFVCLIFGGGIFYIACISFPFNKISIAAIIITLLQAIWRLHKIIIPKDQRLPFAQWKMQRRQSALAQPVQTAETLIAMPEVQKQIETDIKSRKRGCIVFLIFGPVLLGLSLYVGAKVYRLTHEGLHATGAVVELQSDWDTGGHSSTYHPIVVFTDANGAEVRFRSDEGTNPPLYHVGEKVNVLYLADTAQKTAIIDKGIWNWSVTVISGFLGLLMLIGA